MSLRIFWRAGRWEWELSLMAEPLRLGDWNWSAKVATGVAPRERSKMSLREWKPTGNKVPPKMACL